MSATSPIARTPSRRRNEWFWLALILLLGLVLRAWYLTEVVEAPDFTALRQDLDVQDYQARAMITGNWTPPAGRPDPEILGTPYYRPPGYPYYLAAIYWVTGGSYLAPRIVNMVMGLATVLLMFLLGRAVYGVRVGLITAFFMATYWGFLYFEGEVNDPVVFVFLVPCLMLLLRRWGRTPNAFWAFLLGTTTGVYAIMRPNILLFGPVMALWMLWVASRRRAIRRVPASWFSLALGSVLIIAPVTVRNYLVSGEFVPISTYFGENLLIGNGDGSDGITSWTPYLQQLEGTGSFSVWVYPNIVRGLGKEVGVEDLKHSEASRIFAQKALAYMRQHQLRTLKLALKKAILFWSPIEITGNKVIQYEKEHYPPLKYLPGFAMAMALWIMGAAFLVRDWRRGAMAEASGGAVSRSQMTALLFLFILVYYVSFLPFFVNGRARVPIIGLCFLIGAYGLDRVWQLAQDRQWLTAGATVAATAGLWAFASIQWVPYTPDLARWHYARADSYLRQGQVDEAAAEAEAMLSLSTPPMNYMPFRLAHAFAGVDRPELAARLFRATLDIDPEGQNPHYRQDVQFHLASQLAEAGLLDESRSAYAEALRANPNDARIYNDLGVLADREGKTDEALAHFQKALEIAPHFALAHSNLGDWYARHGQEDEAVEQFRAAVRFAPDRYEYHYNLARHLAQAGESEAAIEWYRTASRVDPHDPRAHNNLGLIYAEQGRADEAEAQYRAALEADATFTLAYGNLGNLLVKQGRYDEAIEAYEQGLATNPNDAGLHNSVGFLYANRGEVPLAKEHYEKAIAIAPRFALAHNNLANLLAAQGQFDEAIGHYRQALDIHPDFEVARRNLNRLLDAKGDKPVSVHEP